jgi:NADPH:quinone reductase-like Zn-dependent oxidoreductase
MGADEVVNYRATPFEDVVREVDVVFDTIGGETQTRSWKVLKRGGILVSIVQPPPGDTAAAHGVRGEFHISNHRRKDELTKIAHLAGHGQIKILIAAELPLAEARKAQELSHSGHTNGKIVLLVAES